MSHDHRLTDGVTATRTVFEGHPAVLLAGHPDTLADFVAALPADLDHDHTPVDEPRLCTVWPARTTMGFEELIGNLRRTSDAARIDLTVSALGTVRDTTPPASPSAVERDEAMLLRAGVLEPEDVDDFRAHPNRWRHEIALCRKLEDAMRRAGVDPAEGWSKTMRDLIKASAARESAPCP